MRFEIFGYEFVLQWCAWWKFPRQTWVRVDRGNYSIAVSFFWVEFFIFW